jgi:hypothetical protein
MQMNMMAITMRITFSLREIASTHFEIPATPKESSIPKSKTGRPVPMAKKAGRVMPLADFNANGSKTAKNSTAL